MTGTRRRPSSRTAIVLRILAGAAVLVVLGVLFMRSLQSTRAEPYTVERARLAPWTLAIEPASEPAAPLLVVRGPQELVSGLFRQVFSRMMESLSAPTTAFIPLVLTGEFDTALSDLFTHDTLLAAARDAGLEATAFEPRCLAHRRISQPGATRQLYYAVFESEAFERFRSGLAARVAATTSPGGFDPEALSPVMFVAASDSRLHSWLPLRVDQERDCVAPFDVR